MLEPDRIVEDLWASWRTQVLVSSIELDLFTHLATGTESDRPLSKRHPKRASSGCSTRW